LEFFAVQHRCPGRLVDDQSADRQGGFGGMGAERPATECGADARDELVPAEGLTM